MNYSNIFSREAEKNTDCSVPLDIETTNLLHEVNDKKTSPLDFELNNLKRAYNVFLEPSDNFCNFQEVNIAKNNIKYEKEFSSCDIHPIEFCEPQITDEKQLIHSLLKDDLEFECCLCFFKGTIFELQNHTKLFHQEEANKSKWCQLSSENLAALKQHHTQGYIFHCLTCSKRFKRQSQLLAHLPDHSEKKCLKCPTCEKLFPAQRYLVRHLECHDKEVKPCFKNVEVVRVYSRKCTICQKDFAKKESLAKHMRIHTRDLLKCSHCDFTCSKKVTLKMHIVSHEGNRKYKCSKCDFSFKQIGHLKRHLTRFNH